MKVKIFVLLILLLLAPLSIAKSNSEDLVGSNVPGCTFVSRCEDHCLVASYSVPDNYAICQITVVVDGTPYIVVRPEDYAGGLAVFGIGTKNVYVKPGDLGDKTYTFFVPIPKTARPPA